MTADNAMTSNDPVRPADMRPDDAYSLAVRRVAAARAECAQLGLNPREFAELLLPEALLAVMVDGMTQSEVGAFFSDFAREEIPKFFMQVKRATGYCDCQREAMQEHDSDCRETRVRDSLFKEPRLVASRRISESLGEASSSRAADLGRYAFRR
jgi:hypothetical protein